MDSNLTELSGETELKDFLREKAASGSAEEHYIKYQFNECQSLIKVDMREQPFQFWFYDLQKRPALQKNHKKIISEFLAEHGQKDDISVYFHDLYNSKAAVDASLGKNTVMAVDDPLSQGVMALQTCKRQALVLASPKLKGAGSFGMFSSGGQVQDKSVDPANTPKIK